MPLNYRSELNAEQYAVVSEGDGPCLVLAGAGSGKTRTIVYRVAWLLEHNVAPENILLLTFTNKAASEMMTRIGELMGEAGTVRPHGLWGGTFHSIANRLLRTYAERLGFTHGFSIIDQDDAKTLIKAAVKDCGFDAGRKFPSPAVIQDVISYGRNSQTGLEAAVTKHHPHLYCIVEDIRKVSGNYDNRKRKANAMDFDDLLTKWLELLQQDPVLKRNLVNHFRYILVDEYQDTNALQNAIIRELAPQGHNLLVVGDDAQSIYSFRAADVRNILGFPRFYEKTQVFKLETNYRSTPQILDLANDVISRNLDQFEKDLRAVRDAAQKPAIVAVPSAAREAEFIADNIETLLAQKLRPRDIAVLFRASNHSQALEFELTRRGITYDYRGGLRFFDRAHVKDALAWLRVRQNFADEAAWLRILGIHQGVGDVAARKIFNAFQQSGSLERSVLIDGESIVGARAAVGWRDFHTTLEAIVAAGDVPSAIIRAVAASPYAEYLETEYPNWRERLEDIEQIARFAEQYDKLSDFLAEVTLDEGRASKGKSTENAVVLSTVHQAKGLEWPVVFVIHLTASSFPNKRAQEELGGIEEERRLFYVAVTRAKDKLFLSHPATIGRGSFDFEERSMFLEELSHHVVDNKGDGKKHHDGVVFMDDADETVEIDADGETHSTSILDIQNRMKTVNKDWKKKSFLGDY